MPTIPEISFCLCCGERIEYHPEVGYWTHPDGTRHYDHCARPVNELELLREQVIELQKRLEATTKERDSLRQMLFTETGQDRLQEMPY